MKHEPTPPTSPNEPVHTYLFIVSRHTPYIADYMREQFASEPNVEVIVDRRQGQRRRSIVVVVETERRTGERRRRHDVDKELRESFHALVTLA